MTDSAHPPRWRPGISSWRIVRLAVSRRPQRDRSPRARDRPSDPHLHPARDAAEQRLPASRRDAALPDRVACAACRLSPAARQGVPGRAHRQTRSDTPPRRGGRGDSQNRTPHSRNDARPGGMGRSRHSQADRHGLVFPRPGHPADPNAARSLSAACRLPGRASRPPRAHARPAVHRYRRAADALSGADAVRRAALLPVHAQPRFACRLVGTRRCDRNRGHRQSGGRPRTSSSSASRTCSPSPGWRTRPFPRCR